ncbi:MAG: peptide-methionine (S)-S-oxide reductase MsrA [Devosia sp.]
MNNLNPTKPVPGWRKLTRAAMIVLWPAAAAFGLWNATASAQSVLPVAAPAPAIDVTSSGDTQVAVFAGGCFWGVQGVFQHVKGVKSAVSGYAGGTMANPSYEDVLTETTGHAEAVRVEFDPSQVTYGQLLQIFFSVIADPTTLNYQGNDYGESYRSALFVMNDEQKKVADAYIAQLDVAKVYPAKIVTEVTAYTNFYQAEDYHQDNAYTQKVNPGYLAYFDLPKIAAMKQMFSRFWLDKPVLVFASNA